MTTTTDQTAAPEVETIGGYKVHPAARLLPNPTPEDYARLKADIEQHGLLVPIVLTPAGEILDGRTRARICNELGIKSGPYDLDEFYHKITATLDSEEARDPVAYVLSVNAARRHLSATKIVEIYLEANKAKVEADQQAAKATQQAGLKKGTVRGITNADLIEANQKAAQAAQPARGVNTTPTGKTAARIAEATGVSESTVKSVLRSKKGAPGAARRRPPSGLRPPRRGRR